jgi:hypothetical protein
MLLFFIHFIFNTNDKKKVPETSFNLNVKLTLSKDIRLLSFLCASATKKKVNNIGSWERCYTAFFFSTDIEDRSIEIFVAGKFFQAYPLKGQEPNRPYLQILCTSLKNWERTHTANHDVNVSSGRFL